MRFWSNFAREHGVVGVGVDFGESQRRLRSTFATTPEEDHANANCREPWGIDLRYSEVAPSSLQEIASILRVGFGFLLFF